MKPTLFYMGLAILAGLVLPIQAAVNAKLGKAVADPYLGTWLSFIVGTVGLLIFMLVMRVPFHTAGNALQEHWTVWMGGLLGAVYVVSLVVLVPKIGTGLAFGLVIAGQMGLSLFVDHYGWWGVPIQAINWQRVAGVALIIGGVLLLRNF